MKEKGQTEIFVIVLIAIGIILFFNLGGIRKNLFSPATQQMKTGNSQMVINTGSSYTPPSSSAGQNQSPPAQQKTENLPDTVPPLRSDPQPTGNLPSNTLKTTVSLKTDEIAACRYSNYENVSYDAMYNFFQNTDSTFHSTEITTLSPDTEFNFYAKCVDKFGNKNIEDFEINFKVEAIKDVTPPERRYLSPSGILPAGTKSTTLTVTTDEKAYCYYSTYQGKDFWSGARSFSQNETQTYHTSIVSGLEDGKTYDFYVRCVDLAGNTNIGDILIRFQITP